MPAEGRLTKKRIDALPLRIMELSCHATADGLGMDGDHAATIVSIFAIMFRMAAPTHISG